MQWLNRAMLRLLTENTLDREEESMVKWIITNLEECTDVLGDGLHGTPKYTENGEYAFINGNNLVDGEILIKKQTKRVDYSQYEKYKKPLTDRTILVSINGTLGNVGVYDSEKIILGKSACYFNVKESVDKDFIYYIVSSPMFRQYLENNATGTTIKNISLKQMREYTFSIPQIDEQKRISSVLRKIDEKIRNNRAINNNLEQQAVLLFKKWFIEFDNTSKNILETRFGLIPESFKLLKNGELPLVVTDYVANGSFASLKANVTLYQEPNYAYFIRNTDLKSGTFEVFVDEHSYNFLSKSTLYGGEIIISNVGDVGSVFLCPKLDKPMTLGNNIIMLRPEQENLRYYLYIWFKWLYGQSLIQGIKGGSAQPKFNKTDFKNLPIFLPPDDLLEQFHKIVKPMFELIDENNAENQTLIRTRDAILPRLMSGELDVSDIDI